MGRQLELLSEDAPLHNVFFAALPDTAMSASTERIARDVGRRLQLTAAPIPSERLHVSLLAVGGFYGSCPPAVIDTVIGAADTVSMAPFRVEFDRVASFSGGRGKRALVLTGEGDRIAGLVALGSALSQAVMKAGLKLPRQSGSSPHLTMMYESQICDFAIEPTGWTVDRFVLVDSLFGQSRHVHLGQWFL